MKVIASAMPADEIAGLAEIFKSIDADNSGTITAEELSAALKDKGSLLKRVRGGVVAPVCVLPIVGCLHPVSAATLVHLCTVGCGCRRILRGCWR